MLPYNIPLANQKLLLAALLEYGTKEITGNTDSARIKMYADFLNIKYEHDEESWCALAMSYICKTAGLVAPVSLGAIDFWQKPFGTLIKIDLASQSPYTEVRKGDVAIFYRGDTPSDWHSHVTVIIDIEGDYKSGFKIHGLGGNQSNAFNVGVFDAKKLRGIRRFESQLTNEIDFFSYIAK